MEMRPRIASLRPWSALAPVVVVTVTLIAAACGSSSTDTDDTSDTTVETTTTTVGTLDADQLDAALLTVGDLPPGFTVQPAPEGEELSPLDPYVCPNGAEILKEEPHDYSAVEFSESEAGPFVFQTLSSAPDAEEHFGDVKNALDSCVGETWTASVREGLAFTYSFEQGSTAVVGDEAVAYRITGDASTGSGSLSMDLVYVRNATVVEKYSGLSLTRVADPVSGAVMFPDVLTAEEFASIIEAGDANVTEAFNA